MSKLSFLHDGGNKSEAAKVLAAVTSAFKSMDKEVQTAGLNYAKESFSVADQEQIRTTFDSMRGALERSLTQNHASDFISNKAGMASALESAMMAKNVRNVLNSGAVVTAPTGVANFTGIVGAGTADGTGQRMRAAREAYDERDNSHVLETSVTYNLLAGRQAPAAELFFPTKAVPTDNVGISVTIRLFQVMQDKKRNLSGAVTDFDRRNLIDAMIDDEILRNDSTLAIPIYRTTGVSTVDNFMAGVTPVTRLVEGRAVVTAPLAFNKRMDLIALSADNDLIASGVMDITDSLDTDIRLINVYLEVGDDIIRVRTDNIAGNNFIYVGQDNYRVQKLQLRTETLYIDKYSKTLADADLAEAALTPIKTNDYIVRLTGVFSGVVNINEGSLQVESALAPKVEAVLDAATKTNVILGAGAAIKTALEAGKWSGYDVEARRANSNRRERGDLIDTQYYTQQWAVPLRSPVTSLRPVNSSGQLDADDLEKLASTTYARTSGQAMVTLLNTVDQLRSLRGLNMEPKVQPETLGVGRWLVNSMLIEETVDAAANVASLTSSELEDDISAMLVNRIRDVYYRLYRDSKFQAVVESGAAGTTKQPTCIVMADPMTARYLMIKGDIRTIGPDFDMEVRTTPNKRIENKIVIAMGYPESNGSNDVNPLHYGAMLWSPELALVLPISRNGQTSKELTVQPRFRHIVNVPVMGLIEVLNLSEVVQARVPVDFNDL